MEPIVSINQKMMSLIQANESDLAKTIKFNPLFPEFEVNADPISRRPQEEPVDSRRLLV